MAGEKRGRGGLRRLHSTKRRKKETRHPPFGHRKEKKKRGAKRPDPSGNQKEGRRGFHTFQPGGKKGEKREGFSPRKKEVKRGDNDVRLPAKEVRDRRQRGEGIKQLLLIKVERSKKESRDAVAAQGKPISVKAFLEDHPRAHAVHLSLVLERD